MQKRILSILTAVSIAIGVALPAQRADAGTITDALTAVGDPSNVACPGSLTVNASAAGPRGTPLSYTVITNFNGQVATIVPATQFTLGPSGIANTNIVVQIPKLTGSDNYIELMSPLAGTLKPVKLSVACAVAGGDLAVPSGLARAETAAACQAHFSDASLASSCQNADATKFVLQWDYDKDGCVNKPCAAPDGFNILRSDNGAAYELTDTQNREPGQTAILFNEPISDIYHSCFEVQARKGSTDLGAPSSAYCFVPDPVILDGLSFMDTNDNFTSKMMSADMFGSCPASGGNPLGQSLFTPSPLHQIVVGYIMQDNTCSSNDSLHQGVVQFDLTHLQPYKIRSAVFQLHVTATAENAGTPDSHSNGHEVASGDSCAVAVGTPLNWKLGSPLPKDMTFDKIASLPNATSDGTIRVDVTDAVRKWVAPGGSNNGLVVSSRLKTIMDVYNVPGSDKECLTAYDGVGLTITYEN
jgi:hypothetical protein